VELPPPESGARAAAKSSADEPNFAKMRDTRTLLFTFTNVMTNTLAAKARCSPPDVTEPRSRSGNDGSKSTTFTPKDVGQTSIVTPVVQAWAPGIFALAQNLASLHTVAGPEMATVALVLSRFAEMEQRTMLGHKPGGEDMEERLPQGLDARTVRAVRNMLWEIRIAAFRAARVCITSPGFWAIPEACTWVESLAKTVPLQQPHHADMLLKEVLGPALLVSLDTSAQPELQAKICSIVVPPLVCGVSQLLRYCWSQAASCTSVPLASEGAKAAAAVSLSRTSSRLLADLSGSGLYQAGLMIHMERHLLRGGNPSPQIEGSNDNGGAIADGAKKAGKKRKNPSRNRFAALAQQDESMGDESAAVVKSPPTAPEVPRGAVLSILRDRSLRDGVREALVGLLLIPEKETVERALLGLSIWTRQLWNLICRGEDSTAAAAGVAKGKLLETGELLHSAGDALRVLPQGVLRPVAALVTAPPLVVPGSNCEEPEKADTHRVVDCSVPLASSVQTSWAAYISATKVHGKSGPAPVVSDATQVVVAVLTSLTRLFKLQCRKLRLEPHLQHMYLCPALSEAAQICRGLHNTTEADVEAVLKVLIDEDGVTSDAQRGAIRALLHEASPAFAACPRSSP